MISPWALHGILPYPPAAPVSFYPSAVKRVANRILEEYLNGKEYDEEDKELVTTICEKIKNGVKGAFLIPTSQRTPWAAETSYMRG